MAEMLGTSETNIARQGLKISDSLLLDLLRQQRFEVPEWQFDPEGDKRSGARSAGSL